MHTYNQVPGRRGWSIARRDYFALELESSPLILASEREKIAAKFVF